MPSPKASPEQLRARQERRRSNAAGTHANKAQRRTRTRAAARTAALRDQE